MNQDWYMRPMAGIGDLEFNSPVQTPETWADRYGRIESTGPIGISDAVAEETFRLPGMDFSEEEIAEMMAAIQVEQEMLSDQFTQIYDSGLHLTYSADHLTEILTDTRAFQIHVDGALLFRADPIPALRKLQELNAEAPFINGPDCYFRNIHVTAFEFVVVTAGGRVRPTAIDTDEALQKTISWRATPRSSLEDLKSYQQFDLTHAS